jgi:hypothetical protein
MPVDLLREIVFRWSEPDPRHVSLLSSAGATAVVPDAPNEAFQNACTQAGIRIIDKAMLSPSNLAGFGAASKSKTAILSDGLWPGITNPAAKNGEEPEASASRDPWVDANGYLVDCLKALYPGRPPLLGYLPPEKTDKMLPFESLELALMEAWASGGNYIMTVEPRYRRELLSQNAKALEAWKSLGRTAKWLRANQALFQGEVMPTIATLVDGEEASTELVNLMYRRSVSPRLISVERVPSPDPACLELVAADVKGMDGPLREKVLAHAKAGASVVITAKPDPGWTKIKSQEDRDFYQLGRGQVVAYHEAIADPNEFALDVIDVISHRSRAVRIWNANSAITLATLPPRNVPAKALMIAINYGSPAHDVQVRIQGVYGSATWVRPDGASTTLKASKRGTMTEVFLPDLNRMCVVQFS